MLNIERELRRTLHTEDVRDTDIQRVLVVCRQAHQKKTTHSRTGAFAFLLRQVGFIGWRIWLLQAAALGVMLLGLWTFCRGDSLLHHLPAMVSCCSILAILTAVPMLRRATRYRMMEVESASRYSYRSLFLARLCSIAFGDAMMLLGIVTFTVLQTESGLQSILLYTTVPSTLLSALILLLLPHLSKRSLSGIVWVAGILEIPSVWVVRVLCPVIFTPAFIPGWVILCGIAFGCGVWHAAKSLNKASFMDRQFAAI